MMHEWQWQLNIRLKEKGTGGDLEFTVQGFQELANNCRGFFERRGVEFWLYQGERIVGEAACGLIRFWNLTF